MIVRLATNTDGQGAGPLDTSCSCSCRFWTTLCMSDLEVKYFRIVILSLISETQRETEK